jgi:hypothetical protein
MFEKISRVIIILLLAGILGVQVFTVINKPQPSKDCLAAIDEAAMMIDTMKGEAGDTLTQYQTAAYDTAKNINQQIFMANEYSLINITLMTEYTESLLKVQTACR